MLLQWSLSCMGMLNMSLTLTHVEFWQMRYVNHLIWSLSTCLISRDTNILFLFLVTSYCLHTPLYNHGFHAPLTFTAPSRHVAFPFSFPRPSPSSFPRPPPSSPSLLLSPLLPLPHRIICIVVLISCSFPCPFFPSTLSPPLIPHVTPHFFYTLLPLPISPSPLLPILSFFFTPPLPALPFLLLPCRFCVCCL